MTDYAEELAKALMEMIPRKWERPWDDEKASGFLPYNAISGKEYQGSNTIRLLSEQENKGYQDSRWLTYQQATELGGFVRKGEKGTTCVKWIFKEVEEEKTDGTIQKIERGIPKYFKVFNVSQCENIPPPPQQDEKPEQFYIEQCESLLKQSGAKIYHDGGNMAFYRPSSDDIHLPNKESFHSSDHYYSTAFHELTHWTGHSSRLDRPKFVTRNSPEYAREELVAEIGSMLIGERLNIGRDPKHIEQHYAYLKNWQKLLTDEPKEIIKACREAEKACQFLHIPHIEHKPTLKENPQVERGKCIANINEMKVEYFPENTPQADVLGVGWGFIGTSQFPYTKGGFSQKEDVFNYIGENYGTKVIHQIPRNVKIGLIEDSGFVPYKLMEISTTSTVYIAKEGKIYSTDIDNVVCQEGSQHYPFKNVIKAIELAQEKGIKTQYTNGKWTLIGLPYNDTTSYTTQLEALSHIAERVPNKTDREVGEDLRARLMTASTFGNTEALPTWEKLTSQYEGSDYDKMNKIGHDIRQNKHIDISTTLHPILEQIKKDNGFTHIPKNKQEPALSL